MHTPGAWLIQEEINPMTRTNTKSLACLLGFALAFTSIGRIEAQEAQPASSPIQQSAQPISPTGTSQPPTESPQTEEELVQR